MQQKTEKNNSSSAYKGALAKKLILATVFISSILALIITCLQLYIDFTHGVDGIDQALQDIEKGYKESIIETVWTLNESQIQKQLKGIVSLPYIVSAKIILRDKTQWKASQSNTKRSSTKHDRIHQFELIKHYKNQNRHIGSVILTTSLDHIYANIYNKAILIFLTNALKTFLVSIFILFYFYYSITRHLHKLATHTQNINLESSPTTFKLDRKKNYSNPDELDQLADALTSMQTRLNESYQNTHRSNSLLTKELATNREINIALTQSNTIIERKENVLESIINNLAEGVIILDEDLSIIQINHATESFFSASKDQLLGTSISKIVPTINIKTIQGIDASQPVIVNSSLNTHYGINKANHQFPLRISIALLPIDTGLKYVCTCFDITDELVKAKQLRHSQKMDALGKLTGGIAHDYNNMLNIILGYASLLETSLDQQPKLAKFVQHIQHAGERGVKLTSKLLAFSGNESSDPTSVCINTFLNDQISLLQQTLTPRILVSMNLAEDIWPINIDISDLEDAILNISINAMHAIDNNGELNFSTSNQTIHTPEAQLLDIPAGNYVSLRITDTGSGMDDATKEKIFDPFYTTKQDKGTGLGLSQVYGFIERSHGAIKVYSEIDHGTCFNLYFPFDTSQPKTQTETKLDTAIIPAQHTTKNKTVLIVDDEGALVSLCSEILSTNGYQTLEATSAQQALSILEKSSVDILISDIIMPGIDGYKLAAIVQEKHPAIKIQLASGFTDNRHTNKINDDLHNNILQKPYTSETLLKSLHNLLP